MMTDTTPDASTSATTDTHPAHQPDNSQPDANQPDNSQPDTNQPDNQTHTNQVEASPDASASQTYTVSAASGKRVALIASVMLVIMQLLVTIVVLVSQPAAAPDARAWLFVISSWLLASIVAAAVWQIAVFAQQARLRFVATGLEVSRPGILGILTRQVLLPYSQLRTVRVDLSDYPNALMTTLVSEQRSIAFDLLNLRQQGKRVLITSTEQLSGHPLIAALEARGMALELLTTPDDNDAT